MESVIDTLQDGNNFTEFLRLIFKADFSELLEKEGLYTVLAPVDSAFKNLPDNVYEELAKDKEKAKQVVAEHIITGRYAYADLLEIDEVINMNNRNLAVEDHNEGLIIGGAKVIESNIECSNGLVQTIDVVMLS